jgi:hypothetical protein
MPGFNDLVGPGLWSLSAGRSLLIETASLHHTIPSKDGASRKGPADSFRGLKAVSVYRANRRTQLSGHLPEMLLRPSKVRRKLV